MKSYIGSVFWGRRPAQWKRTAESPYAYAGPTEYGYDATMASTDEILTDFARCRAEYASFAERVASLLRSAIAAAGIRTLVVESRAKTTDSVREKLGRPGKHYDNLEELSDLAGVRVIAFYQDDCVRIADLVKTEFGIVEEELSHQQEHLGSDKFGYISAHYVVRTSEARKDLIEWKSSADLICEIQIRTVIQHAWSVVSHEIQYKSEQVPSRLQRRLNRISGLFELADEEFVGIRQQKHQLDKDTEKALKANAESVELSATGVLKFSENWGATYRVENRVKKIGFKFIRSYEGEAANQIVTLALKASVGNMAGLAERVGPFDESYMTAQFQHENTSDFWSVSLPFVLELHLIRALATDLKVDDLVDVGWDASVSKRVLAVAKTNTEKGTK